MIFGIELFFGLVMGYFLLLIGVGVLSGIFHAAAYIFTGGSK